ncbi:MAG: DeoR/GlpR family DNA-binding transcription regulator, partial [Spirochaetales bacterium]|nr:DeoR/GlpR family DNA-binding transcription regulator [Spirochaetales bacterium]
MGKRDDRLSRIVELVDAVGAFRIRDLSDALGVTEVTIRRDLHELKRRDLIRVFHGVAASNDTGGSRSADSDIYRIDEAEHANIAAKRAIARHAAALIEPGEIVYFDPGTTTELVARLADPNIAITVVTTALNISDYVAHNTSWSLVNPGGLLHRGPMMFEGDYTVEFLNKTRAHRAFISASGLTPDLGVTCTNFFEIAVKQKAIRTAQQSVLVLDSSKFGSVHLAFFGEVQDFDLI